MGVLSTFQKIFNFSLFICLCFKLPLLLLIIFVPLLLLSYLAYIFISKIISNISELNDQIKSIHSSENKMINFLKDDKLQSIINIEQQINYISQKNIQMNNEINKLNNENIKNTLNIKSIEILNILLFLNNIRLLLYSRKYVNTILRFEIKKNKKLRISKKKYLIDFAGLKFKEEKLIQNYISNFIIMTNINDDDNNIKFDKENDNIINNNNNNNNNNDNKDIKIYNLTLDFLYFIKNYFNNNVHLVSPVKDLNYNTLFLKMFSKDDTKENSEDEITDNTQNDSNKEKSQNGKKEKENSSIIYNNEKEDEKQINYKENFNDKKEEEEKIIAYNIQNKGVEIIKGQNKSEEKISGLDIKLEAKFNKKDTKFISNNNNNVNNIENNDFFMDINISNDNFINTNNNYFNKNEHSFKDNEKMSQEINITYFIKNINIFAYKALKDDINEIIELDTDFKIDKNKNILIDYEKEINNILEKPDFFSFKELLKNSVDNLKKIFIKYFTSSIEEKIITKYIPLLIKENAGINKKFQFILDKINYYKLFLEILLNNRKESYNDNNKLLDSYIELSIENIKSLIPNVNELKNNILALKDTLEKYKEKKLLFEIIKNEKEEVYQSINNDQDILTFENLFDKWKLQFSSKNIEEIKKKYNINKKEKKFQIKLKNKSIEVEYLYESKEYLKYIDIDLMNNLNLNVLLDNIEKIAKDANFSFFSIDEEIDYSNIKHLE